jgi:hypothetical protein
MPYNSEEASYLVNHSSISCEDKKTSRGKDLQLTKKEEAKEDLPPKEGG